MPPKKEGVDVNASTCGIAGRPARGASTSTVSQQQYIIETFDARPLRTSRRWSMNLAGYLYGTGQSVASLGFPQTVCVYYLVESRETRIISLDEALMQSFGTT
jgi:hypothetical protein